MTNFNAALVSGDYTLLRSGGYAADYLITLCSNRVVFAGQVNSDLTTPTAWAQFSYNNVSAGAYTAVELNQVLLIGTTNDSSKAEFRGRIRLAPSSSIIYCNESSQDFSVGAYFWVLDTYDPNYKLSRPDANGNELIDYNVAYAGPEPMVVGLRTAYVDDVDSGTGKMRVAFNVASSYATVPSGTISSYQFTFTAGTYTVISGALNTSAVTVDFNPGEQWGKLVITDSGGVTKTRRFYIKAIDANNPADLSFDNCTITGDLNRGWTLSVPAFAGVDGILPDTFCVMWRTNERYAGTAGELYSTNNIAFTGWFQREDVQAGADQTASIIEDARFEFTGIGPRMARLTAQLLAIRLASSPSVWGELSTLTPWRAISHFLSRYTTVGNLCDVDFSDKTDTFLFPAISTQGGNVFAAVSGIAGQINALLETAPDGRIQVNRNAEFLTAVQRSTLTTVANWTTQDTLSVNKARDQNRSVGIVDGDAATYNSVTGLVTVFTARAPGIAQGEAQGRSTLPSQIIAYNSDPANVLEEIRLRVGQKYEIDNNSEVIVVEFDGGYAPALIPSKGQLHTFTYAALTANGVDRINYTTSDTFTLESVTIAQQGSGAVGVRSNWRKLNRVGDLGDNTTLPPQNSIADPAPDLGEPAFPSFEDIDTLFPEDGWTLAEANPAQLATPPGVVLATNGNTVIASNGTNAWLLKNFIALKVPQAVDVTPSDLGSYTIKQVLFDPFGTKTAQGAYILASDGVNSAVWWTANVAAVNPTWTKGADVQGVYTVIRAANASGAVLIYAPDAGVSLDVTYDFTASNGGFTAFNYLGLIRASYSAGNGWTVQDTNQLIQISSPTFSARTVTQIKVFLSGTSAFGGGEIQYPAASAPSGTQYAVSNPTLAASPLVFNGNASLTDFWLNLDATAGHSLAGIYITSIELYTTTGATVRYSSNNGSTFGSEVSVGATATGVGGFDTQRAGTNSFAASSGKVRRATTLGGAYSDYYAPTGSAQAACVILPYYKWGSTSTKNTNATNPDIVVGLHAADGSSRTLLWIEGGATPGTVHDITPVASYVFDSPNSITTSYGTYIATAGKVASTYTLRTSKTLGGAGTWTNVATLTTPHFIRTRRNDTSALRSKGQLYVTNGNAISYSSYWGTNGIFPRTMPASGVDSLDILG